MITFISIFFLLNISTPPPGTMKVKNYYVDKSEIQNFHWLEYTWHKKKELDSANHFTLYPDSLNFWYKSVENYFKPICYITYEQAVAYCKWRSDFVSRSLRKKVTYRLPSPEEWREIAQEVLKKDSKRINRELIKAQNKINKHKGKYELVGRERSGKRIYNMFDNVTEMTSLIGVAKGANNYELTDVETNLNKTIKYKGANSYLGFRCIAEVEE